MIYTRADMDKINKWLLDKVENCEDKFFRDLGIMAYWHISDFAKIDLYMKYGGE